MTFSTAAEFLRTAPDVGFGSVGAVPNDALARAAASEIGGGALQRLRSMRLNEQPG